MSNGDKHPDAIARDEWLESDQGRKCLDGAATGQYLQNRLVYAFMAGIEHGRKCVYPEAPADPHERDSVGDGDWYYRNSPKGWIVLMRKDDPVCGGVDDPICNCGLLESDARTIATDRNYRREKLATHPSLEKS